MELLDKHDSLRQEIFDYFGYVEDWRILPLDDSTMYFWRLDGEGPGNVCFADTEQELIDETGEYYENEIYTQRHLSQWVYRGADYTMVVVDTNTDGNQLLQIFDNKKERHYP